MKKESTVARIAELVRGGASDRRGGGYYHGGRGSTSYGGGRRQDDFGGGGGGGSQYYFDEDENSDDFPEGGVEPYRDDRYGDDRYGDDDRYNDDRRYRSDSPPRRVNRNEDRRGYSTIDNFDDPEEDEWSSPARSRDDSTNAAGRFQSSLANMPSVFRTGDRRIGFPLLAGGALITMMGISLFFNKALMRLGNLMFIAGVPLTVGPSRTMGYFMQPKKVRASSCLAAGIFLVFIGWPIFGMALEIFGLLNLFGNMFPVVWAVVKNMPFVSNMMQSNSQNTPRRNGAADRYDDNYLPGDDEDDFDDWRYNNDRQY